MATLFISGNRWINEIPLDIAEEVDRFFQYDTIIVGDADGVDRFIAQTVDPEMLIVYYSGKNPRFFLPKGARSKHIPATGYGRDWHTWKDKAMTRGCDYHIGFVTDFKRESGTKRNHNRVLSLGKKSILVNTTTAEVIHGLL